MFQQTSGVFFFTYLRCDFVFNDGRIIRWYMSLKEKSRCSVYVGDKPSWYKTVLLSIIAKLAV